MPTESDDLDAVRSISAALEPFELKDRERIFRWVRERLGMAVSNDSQELPSPKENPERAMGQPALGASTDIRSFVQAKAPTSGNHVAAVVAYFYRFVSPSSDRKDGIGKDDLVEACRLAEIKRPAAPAQTLINAAGAGLLDRADRGLYRINSVGENLVAMVLPEANDKSRSRTTRSPQPKRAKSKSATPGRKKNKAGKRN